MIFHRRCSHYGAISNFADTFLEGSGLAATQ